MLTEEEIDLLMQMNDLYSQYLELPVQHKDDKGEFVEALHRLQHLVMIRSTRRSHPELFPRNISVEVKSNQALENLIGEKISREIVKNMQKN